MGIKGLTYFISNLNPDCLVPYKLSNTFLIVDGGLTNLIYDELDDDYRFGGDFKLMYDSTLRYFKNLLRCKVTPIVILDGICEEQKIWSNSDSKNLEKLIRYNENGFKLQKGNYYPLFKTEAFIDALKNLGVIYCRADFEADQEIMELAGKLNYPVLSGDSDFYISDGVNRLPWWDAKDGSKIFNLPYISCKRFDRERFVEKWGITACVLPLLAVILPSPYHEREESLLNAIIPNYHENSKLEDKIRCVLIYLRDETLASAKSKIIQEYCREYPWYTPVHFEKGIDPIIENYTTGSCTVISALEKYDVVKNELANVTLNVRRDDLIKKYNVPVDIMNMVREGQLLSTTLDMFTLKRYTTKFLLEDLNQEPAHAPAIPLIQSIYTLLNYEGSPSPLKLYIRHELARELPVTYLPNSDQFQIHKIMENDENTQENIKFFDDGWFVFILALLYYRKSCKDRVTEVYIHGILLSALILHAEEICKEEEVLNMEECSTLSNQLKRLTKEDCQVIAEEIPKLLIFKSHEMELTKPVVAKMHLFLTFQTCLFYTMQIFVLLKLPNMIKISNFVSGSLFHFFTSHLESQENCEKWIEDWFNDKGATDLKDLYFVIKSRFNDCITTDLKI